MGKNNLISLRDAAIIRSIEQDMPRIRSVKLSQDSFGHMTEPDNGRVLMCWKDGERTCSTACTARTDGERFVILRCIEEKLFFHIKRDVNEFLDENESVSDVVENAGGRIINLGSDNG